MKSIGKTMMLLGGLAIVLNFANMVPKTLVWIYAWGDSMAMLIKVGAVALGAAIYFIGKSTEKKENTDGKSI